MISASANPLLDFSVLIRERQEETSEVLRRVSTINVMSDGSGVAMQA